MAERDTGRGVALILEGGSMRCQFTAGVTDVLMEAGVSFPACYGVSAGALCGLSVKSRQIGRVNRVNLAFCDDPRYIGARALAETGGFVGYDFMFNDVQDRIDPFDYDAFASNPMELVAVACDITFGTAEYLPVQSASLDMDKVRASTSMPLITRPVEIAGRRYLDGGIADSVPVERALDHDGFDRAVVVLTQHRSYEKGPYALMRAARARYADYPYFLEALETRHERYNAQRERIWELEREGRVVVVAPSAPVEVGHMERDREKLLALYIDGRREAARCLDAVRSLLG